MNSLTRLTCKVIERGYPELSDRNILSYYKKINSSLEWGSSGGEYFIFANTSLKRAPEPVLIGGLAHELSHIVFSINHPFIDRLTESLYNYSKRLRHKIEVSTDLDAIKRGFDKELIEFCRFSYRGESVDLERGLNLQFC